MYKQKAWDFSNAKGPKILPHNQRNLGMDPGGENILKNSSFFSKLILMLYSPQTVGGNIYYKHEPEKHV